MKATLKIYELYRNNQLIASYSSFETLIKIFFEKLEPKFIFKDAVCKCIRYDNYKHRHLVYIEYDKCNKPIYVAKCNNVCQFKEILKAYGKNYYIKVSKIWK